MIKPNKNIHDKLFVDNIDVLLKHDYVIGINNEYVYSIRIQYVTGRRKCE